MYFLFFFSLSPQPLKFIIHQLKLVATNFIANGSIDEGVGLLCLSGKTSDACRYLQAYNRWTDAAWLAQVIQPCNIHSIAYSCYPHQTSLSEGERSATFKRWADHLLPTYPFRAVHVLVSLGEWSRVLEVLVDLKETFRVALLMRLLRQEKIPSIFFFF